ncbi:MAG: PIN domain protein [Candidatus Bathyarchaeota archaeon BA1]|nr:MAG: PIN domain protein [Candidatus Bathyarchaeota archaeon BA1]
MKIFLDANFLIYMNTMLGDERRDIEKLYRKLLEETLFTNVLVVDEVLYISRKRYGLPYNVTLNFLRNIVSPYIEIIPISEEDIKPVEKYLLKYDLKPSDAIHLATMEKVGVSHIVSEDEGLDKVKEVKRIWINID